MSSTQAPPAGTVRMFTTSWCGYCQRLKARLDADGVAYEEVDVEQDPAAEAFVIAANGGNRTVPTVLFPDGSTAINPSATQVRDRLGSAVA